MITTVAAIALAGMLATPAGPLPHEGHEHVLMGIVQKVGDTILEVKVRDEKTKVETVFAVVWNEKTEVLRGDRPARMRDIAVGERTVVRAVMTKDAKGREVYTAKRVQVAARPAGSPAAPTVRRDASPAALRW
jgi:hypothetical protein